MRITNTRFMVLGSCAAGLILPACDQAPSPGQTQNCKVVAHSPSNSFALDYQLTLPSPCPVPIFDIGEIKEAAGEIYDKGARDFDFAELRVSNSKGVVKNGNIARFIIRNVSTASPRVSYPAATGADLITSTAPPSATDFGRFTAFRDQQYDRPDNPYGTVEITYRKSPVFTSLSGPDIPIGNTMQTWTARVSGGRTPYSFGWYRDGALVGTGTSYTGNTGAVPFGLRLEVSDANLAKGVDAMAVDVNGVRVAMSGPNIVYASQGGGTWTASGRGGRTPYTFDWYVDDRFVRRSSSYTGYPGENAHTVHVQMSDAAGATHYATKSVTGLGNSDGTCDPIPPAITCQ